MANRKALLTTTVTLLTLALACSGKKKANEEHATPDPDPAPQGKVATEAPPSADKDKAPGRVDLTGYGLGGTVELPAGARIKSVTRDLTRKGGTVSVKLASSADMSLGFGWHREDPVCERRVGMDYLSSIGQEVGASPSFEQYEHGYAVEMEIGARKDYWKMYPTPFFVLTTCLKPAEATCDVFGAGKDELEAVKKSCLSVKPAAAPAAADGALAMKLDLDGDGAVDEIQITADKVTVGPVSEKFAGKGAIASVDIVDIDRADKRQELVVRSDEDAGEDNETVYVFAFDGKTLETSEVWTGNAPVIEGDGLVKSITGNCGETDTVSWKLDGTALVKASEEKTGTYDESLCAACPYVDVETDAGTVRVGEILRNLRHSGLEQLQSLPLPAGAVRHGRVRVRLSEEKPEVSYIDQVTLQVGDDWFAPSRCEAGASGVCKADGVRTLLGRGEVLDLVFDVGDVPSDVSAVLWARGYYLPVLATD